MRPGIAAVDDVDFMRTITTLEQRFQQGRVVAFKSSSPTKRITVHQNSRSSRRFWKRVIAIIKTKLICKRSFIGWKVGAQAKAHAGVVLKEAFAKIRIENGLRDL